MKRPDALLRAMELLAESDEFVLFVSRPTDDQAGAEEGETEMELMVLTPDSVTPQMAKGVKLWASEMLGPGASKPCRKELN